MYTVLVAENHPRQCANLLTRHFAADCSVREANTSQELFHCITREPVDILLLDMEIPGVRFSELLWLLQDSRRQPLILPIARAGSLDCDAMTDEEAILDYLLKPFSESELILTMEEALHHCAQSAHRRCSAALHTGDDTTRLEVITERIRQYLQDHFTEAISMQDVASAMNYSDTHFCRLFKQCFHINFSVYLNELRVEQAKKLLANTNQTVKEVSLFCGYRDTSYFIRVFRRFTGMTPSEYRIYGQTMTAKKYNKS